jgi:hypothetical protein
MIAAPTPKRLDMSRGIIVVAAAIALSGCVAATATGDIAHLGRSKSAEGIVGEVTAQSRYGSPQTVSGPVRRISQNRLEVRLPGGTWVECVRSCSETLRRQTVDFWQNYGGAGNVNGGEDGPGYLKFLGRP